MEGAGDREGGQGRGGEGRKGEGRGGGRGGKEQRGGEGRGINPVAKCVLRGPRGIFENLSFLKS